MSKIFFGTLWLSHLTTAFGQTSTHNFIVKIICHLNIYILQFNPLTLMSDQDRISLYNIKQKSDENTEKY